MRGFSRHVVSERIRISNGRQSKFANPSTPTASDIIRQGYLPTGSGAIGRISFRAIPNNLTESDTLILRQLTSSNQFHAKLVPPFPPPGAIFGRFLAAEILFFE